MKALYNYISLFDIYGIGFALRYHCHENYRTTVGAIIGLLSILSILILSFFFLQDLFYRTNFSVITNKEESVPLIDLSSFPFLFSFGEASSNLKGENDRLYNYTLQIHKYYNNKSSKTKKTIQNIQMETCDIKKHFKDYEHFFTNINVTLYKCISPGQNITLFNRFGDTNNGFQVLNLYINKCDSKIRSDCFDEKEINAKISNSYLTFLYGTFIINHYNYTHPIQKTIRGELFRFTSTIIKRYFYKLSQSYYITDRGLVFSDNKKEEFYQYNSFYIDIDTDYSLYDKNNIGTITFSCNDTVLVYKRTYPKAQSIIASIGSLANLIYFLCQILVKILTKKMIFANVSNEILLMNQKTNGKPLSFHEALIHQNYTFTTLSPKSIKKKRPHFGSSFVNLNQNNDKTDPPLNHSHKLVRNYKLKIKKTMTNTINQVKDEEKKQIGSNPISLNFFEFLIPKICIKHHPKVMQFYQIEASLFKYLSIETLIPLLEKIEIMMNNTSTNNKVDDSSDSNVINHNNNNFQPKFTFAPIYPEIDFYSNTLFNN